MLLRQPLAFLSLAAVAVATALPRSDVAAAQPRGLERRSQLTELAGVGSSWTVEGTGSQYSPRARDNWEVIMQPSDARDAEPLVRPTSQERDELIRDITKWFVEDPTRREYMTSVTRRQGEEATAMFYLEVKTPRVVAENVKEGDSGSNDLDKRRLTAILRDVIDKWRADSQTDELKVDYRGAGHASDTGTISLSPIH